VAETPRSSRQRCRRPARAPDPLRRLQRGYYLTAFEIAINRAEAGDVAAQTLIAIIYEKGYGVPQNFEKAVE
jgi:TPR repeat protein